MKKSLLPIVFLALANSFSYSQVVDQPDAAIGSDDLFGTVVFGLPVQQSFEAGITGDLTKIEISVYGDSEMDIIVEIYSGSFEDSDLGEAAITSKTVTAPAYLGTSEPYEVSFTNAKVEEGKMYTIQISTNDESISAFVFGESSSSYSLGNYSFGGVTDTEGDAYFKTYVKEDLATSLSSKTKEKTEFTLFPNPSSGEAIQLSESITNAHIFNSFGVEIALHETLENIYVENLESGAYFINSDQGSVSFLIAK